MGVKISFDRNKKSIDLEGDGDYTNIYKEIMKIIGSGKVHGVLELSDCENHGRLLYYREILNATIVYTTMPQVYDIGIKNKCTIEEAIKDSLPRVELQKYIANPILLSAFNKISKP